MGVDNQEEVQFPLTKSDDHLKVPSVKLTGRSHMKRCKLLKGKSSPPFFSGANCSFEGVYVYVDHN